MPQRVVVQLKRQFDPAYFQHKRQVTCCPFIGQRVQKRRGVAEMAPGRLGLAGLGVGDSVNGQHGRFVWLNRAAGHVVMGR